ncbi:hypothetical protein REPUB_Repub06bG0128600 [Reevesia pubescens]
MCTSKSATGGCLARILRRIICSHSLLTYPSDHIIESNSSLASYTKKLEVNVVDKLASKVTPRIVARLMGLDSLPDISLQNEEFFVLRFEKKSEKKELRSRVRKYKRGDGELKQRKEENEEDHQEQANSKRVLNVLNEEKLNRRIVDKPNEEVAKCNDFCLEKPIMIIKGQECSKCVDKKAMPDGAKLRKKRKKIKIM